MKRIIAIIACICLMLAMPALAEGQNITVVTDLITYLREGAGNDTSILGVVPENTTLAYMDETLTDANDAGWYRVQYGDTVGYISDRHAHLVEVSEADYYSIAENSIGNYHGGLFVVVSSERPANENVGINVAAGSACDRNLTTAWNSYNEKQNQWLRVSIASGQRYAVAGLRIASGYWKTDEVYYANNRPRTVDIYCDGIYIKSAMLADVMDLQTVYFDAPVTGNTFELRFPDHYDAIDNKNIYPGGSDQIKDICVTEIELIGEKATVLHPNTLDDWGDAVYQLGQLMANGGSLMQSYDKREEVMGLQLLLRYGFNVYSGSVNGVFDNATVEAVITLSNTMRQSLTDYQPTSYGVVDSAYWTNMLNYMASLAEE